MTAADVERPTLDVSGTAPIPLWRLVRVEMRKLADTRAGLWMLVLGAAVAALVTTGFFIWGEASDRTFLDLTSYGAIPIGFLLPIMGILLITQEWGQRTALITFTQVPHRGKVVVAKVVAALLFALGALIVVALIALPLSLVGGADEPFEDLSVGLVSRILLGLVIGIVWGLAFGLAFLNSAFAIILYFVVPTVVSIVSGIWTAAQENLLWFDLNTSSSKLFEPAAPTGEEWAQIGTGLLIWVVLPGALGVWRVLRSEVK